jgi:hypothetical protein
MRECIKMDCEDAQIFKEVYERLNELNVIIEDGI